MMKPYVKPDLYYEDFQLSHTVANCSPAMNHSKTDCKYGSDELYGILDSNETVFSENACTYTIDTFGKMYEDYCLQTGSASVVLFTS